MKAQYEASYHGHQHKYLIESPFYYSLRARLAKKDYFHNVHDEKVFEFGVGLGKNIAFLKNKSGYDISKFARKFSAERGIKVYDDIKKVPDNHFDIVLSAHTLEHLENPFDNLQLLKTKLKKGGKLILILPVEKHGKVPFATDINQHLFAWNFRTINNLLQRAGFRIIENRYNHGTAYYKLKFLAKISFSLYDLKTRLLGLLLCKKEMIVVCEK
ncbi:MAG TPA: methyltransferase domain-containing protein [Candidatus Nanoarchaeia archaeon]|nr:methyltransferase domain-containing protein [Candidatus Nanoarchaeia archaeon]